MFNSQSLSARPKRTPKAEQTRERIVAAALGLLAESGYEQATMRAIAARSEVSVGNAYYYFPSKDHLIQAFYAQMREELAEAARPIFARERTLKNRLHELLRAWIEITDPYHTSAGALFKTASDPNSPLNPFSAESKVVRDDAIALFRELVEGSTAKIPHELRDDLPALLWSYHMGITLFWIHDGSVDRRRTRLLIDRSVGLIVKLISLSKLPGTGGVRRGLQKLMRELFPEA